MLIRSLPEEIDESLPEIPVSLDRHTLQKRRWRTTANDETDLAIDLEEPVTHGATIAQSDTGRYVVRQTTEPVLVIPLPEAPDAAARLGWFFGNQHMPAEVRKDCLLIEFNQTVADSLDRNHIHYHRAEEVFLADPHSKSAGHHHHHAH